MEKIRILIISSYMIIPPTSGGAQRIVRPISHLKAEDGIEIDMLYTVYDEMEKVREYLEKYPCVHQAIGVRPMIDMSDERAMPEGFCSDVWRTMGMEIKDQAIKMVQEKFYDIIQIEHSMMAWIVPYLKRESSGSKYVLDLHNAEYRVYEKWSQYTEGDMYEEIRKKYENLYAWEMMCWKWFDAAFTVSPVETKLFQETTGCAAVYEVPTGGGIDIEEYEPKNEQRMKPYDMLYLGTMEWYPNAQGLLWFIDSVLPKVLEKRPETKLHIVGYGKPEGGLVQIANEHPNVMFWGQQSDDKCFFHGAKVFIVPLFIGAGARVKIPTAWASRVPVASTVFGPEGLAAVNGENICMSDNPEEYAENILRLLEDEEYHKVITDNAFTTLKNLYSCRVCVDRLKEAYIEIASKKLIEGKGNRNLKQYHIDFMENLCVKTNVEGKYILEIGCGKGDMLKYFARKYKPKFIMGVEPFLEGVYDSEGIRQVKEEEGVNWRICKGDALNIRVPDNSFDIVISVATFEHIPDLDRCLAEIKRVLKPGGVFYTEFGPIWSCVMGHHCRNWIKEEVVKIPAWGHLYMTKQEMYEFLTKNYSQEEAEDICQRVYEDDWINRVDLRTMKYIFKNCGMEILELKENTLVNRCGWLDGSDESELSEKIIERLANHYTPEELKVCSINLFMKKWECYCDEKIQGEE